MTPERNHIGLLGRIAGMKTFRLQLTLLVALYTLVVYGALYFQTQRLAYDSLRDQGSSYFELVKQTRAWNAERGGVWLLKRDGVETNPYLLDIGLEPDIKTESGAELTLRNPSAMMSEISILTEQASGVSFHLVAENPLNPANAPDEWERNALVELNGGSDELGYRETFEEREDARTYRYLEPLWVDDTCVGCHRDEGYVPGTSRGGITVNIPMDDVDSKLDSTAALLAGMTAITLGLSVGASRWFVSRLQSKLDEANVMVSAMAVTDDLTGLANRRATLDHLAAEFSRSKRTRGNMSVIAIDIDHFKRINDQYGHGVGDEVLREIAIRMRSSIREYDALGRIGGEEFLVVAPETDSQTGTALAERILETVRSLPFSVRDLELDVTVSAGVATITHDDARADALVGRADDALYAAKNAGRDCVRTQEGP